MAERNHADGSLRRLAACAERNPANDDYWDGCCRFPKSCSPYPYDETPVTEADLEPRRGGGDDCSITHDFYCMTHDRPHAECVGERHSRDGGRNQ